MTHLERLLLKVHSILLRCLLQAVILRLWHRRVAARLCRSPRVARKGTHAEHVALARVEAGWGCDSPAGSAGRWRRLDWGAWRGGWLEAEERSEHLVELCIVSAMCHPVT